MTLPTARSWIQGKWVSISLHTHISTRRINIGLNGTIVNRTLPFLQRGSLVITLTIPFTPPLILVRITIYLRTFYLKVNSCGYLATTYTMFYLLTVCYTPFLKTKISWFGKFSNSIKRQFLDERHTLQFRSEYLYICDSVNIFLF